MRHSPSGLASFLGCAVLIVIAIACFGLVALLGAEGPGASVMALGLVITYFLLILAIPCIVIGVLIWILDRLLNKI